MFRNNLSTHKAHIYFWTMQLQGFRLVDTLPWMHLLLWKRRALMSKASFSIFCITFLAIPITVILMNNALSAAKLLVFMAICLFTLCLRRPSKPKLTNVGLVTVLILLMLEDLLIAGGNFLSPFVRDPAGAFFIFREKSYFALTLFSILAISKTSPGKAKYFILILIGYFTESGVFWPLLMMFIYCKTFPRKNFIVVFLSFVIFLSYYGLYKFADNPIIQILSYTDLLRFLINLQSLFTDCSGTFYMKSCNQEVEILNLNIAGFAKWENLTAQAPFFLLHTYFGFYGSLTSLLVILIIVSKLIPQKEDHFLRGMIIFSFFVQGFLMNPLLFWALSDRRLTE